MHTRKAEIADIARIMEIISQAKADMRLAGSTQWGDDYPSAAHIEGDISRGDGYVMVDDDGITAYMAITFGGEAAYDTLTTRQGTPYATAHRLAVADRNKGRGVAQAFMLEAEKRTLKAGIRLLRADTNFDNVRMLHIFEKSGMTYAGEVTYPHNGKRLAYEKVLQEE